jgi:hypothetical protein
VREQKNFEDIWQYPYDSQSGSISEKGSDYFKDKESQVEPGLRAMGIIDWKIVGLPGICPLLTLTLNTIRKKPLILR